MNSVFISTRAHIRKSVYAFVHSSSLLLSLFLSVVPISRSSPQRPPLFKAETSGPLEGPKSRAQRADARRSLVYVIYAQVRRNTTPNPSSKRIKWLPSAARQLRGPCGHGKRYIRVSSGRTLIFRVPLNSAYIPARWPCEIAMVQKCDAPA